jgi:hypothetical protein
MSNGEPKNSEEVPAPVVWATVGFPITAALYWWRGEAKWTGYTYVPQYAWPLWIGIGVAAALLIAVGYGVSKIWRDPARDTLKITGLIYLSSLVIMTFGRILTP